MSPRNFANGWIGTLPKITDPIALESIRKYLESNGPIIVEHWFYYGSRSPARMIFDEFSDFDEYLDLNARPGDAFHIWKFPDTCRDDNEMIYGKYPDSDGLTPPGGAY